jgi:hypothetical protein
MTIGQTLAFIGIILGVAICTWATMLFSALVFNEKCATAKSVLVKSAKSTIALGLFLGAFFIFLGTIAFSTHHPIGMVIGWVTYTLVLSTAAIGSGGVATLASEQIRKLAPDMSEYDALSRGAAITFLFALTPVLGWFFIAPVALGASIGAGLKAVLGKPLHEAKLGVAQS